MLTQFGSEKVKVYFILICSRRVCVCMLVCFINLLLFCPCREKVLQAKNKGKRKTKNELTLAKDCCAHVSMNTYEPNAREIKIIKAHEARTIFQGTSRATLCGNG